MQYLNPSTQKKGLSYWGSMLCLTGGCVWIGWGFAQSAFPAGVELQVIFTSLTGLASIMGWLFPRWSIALYAVIVAATLMFYPAWLPYAIAFGGFPLLIAYFARSMLESLGVRGLVR